MPQIEPQNIKSIKAITEIGREGAKTSNYPDDKTSYAGAVMSDALTHQNNMSNSPENKMSGNSSY